MFIYQHNERLAKPLMVFIYQNESLIGARPLMMFVDQYYESRGAMASMMII